MKKRGFLSYLLFIFLSFIVVLILSGVVVWFVVFREYGNWEGRFEDSHLSTDFITLDQKVIEDGLNKKVDEYSKSQDNTDFIEVSKEEAMYLVGLGLNDSLPDNISFEKGYIDSKKGSWDIYIKLKYNDKYSLPWIVATVIKDEIESPELYIDRVLIGDFDFEDFGVGIIVKEANRGLRDAVTLINSSDFTGREIKNIELGTKSVVIKGEK